MRADALCDPMIVAVMPSSIATFPEVTSQSGKNLWKNMGESDASPL